MKFYTAILTQTGWKSYINSMEKRLVWGSNGFNHRRRVLLPVRENISLSRFTIKGDCTIMIAYSYRQEW